MQTSAKGTYRGMLDCAGGILKNEGPLAFYKVHFEFVKPHSFN
jgi:solute carrier family 25 (mitochondrial carnitine/acylcarnitine transporter), member 20/29